MAAELVLPPLDDRQIGGATVAQSRLARLARPTVTTTGTLSILSIPNSEANVRGLGLERRAPVAATRE